MLGEAGLGQVTVRALKHDPINRYYVARRQAARPSSQGRRRGAARDVSAGCGAP
jgi:hypothetical protein